MRSTPGTGEERPPHILSAPAGDMRAGKRELIIRRHLMRWTSIATAAALTAIAAATLALAQPASTAGSAASTAHGVRTITAADGFTIHVVAPHMISGQEMGPVHHYCKPIAPDPIIQCLLYDTPDANAPLTGIEYIVAKRITRSVVSRGTWNANFHDHTLEIATGRVKVLDMPADEAKKVADLVSTTDGIIFNLWPEGDRIPTGSVEIGQSVGHRPMSADEYRRVP
jgi:hypothetical protein